MHSGRIWTESDGPALGARFAFTLLTLRKRGAVALGGVRIGLGRSSGLRIVWAIGPWAPAEAVYGAPRSRELPGGSGKSLRGIWRR